MSKTKPDNYKTKICRNWENGHCVFGNKCHFAHGESELVDVKPKLCWFFSNSKCHNGNKCPFLHVTPGLNQTIFMSENVFPMETNTLPVSSSSNCWDSPSPAVKSPFSSSPNPFATPNSSSSSSSPFVQTQPKRPRKNPFPIRDWSDTSNFESQDLTDEEIEMCYQFYTHFKEMMQIHESLC